MRLLRVQVPEFRALKDVDISFEPDFNPQVFPLGSLNGGGKSTLLQLIFVLLHCFGDASRRVQLENITNELKNSYSKSDVNNLATITLLTSYGKVILRYFYGNKGKILKEINDEDVNCLSFLFDYSPFIIKIHYLNYPKKTSPDEWNEIQKGAFDMLSEAINREINSKIFLIIPSNQPYLFLSREERRALFTANKNIQSNVPNLFESPQYDQAVRKARENLPNFFTFDFVDVLVEVFRRARANDFKERNKDNPFAHTEKLEADINNLFIDGKKIASLIIEQQRHTQDEIQGVFFKLPSGEELYPEDLSHGELKRLAIFVLIKYHEMQDAIVLIDEIENGFHPRWQRYIVDDLVEWGATNQYILATHSYEVCRNLTFEHIKELSPRLFSENQE
jgi:energy-coupling factor transporter ATP-binding protein EcfA2